VRETEMENAMGKGQRAWVSSLLCNSMWFTSVLFEHAQGKHEFKSTLVQGLEGVHEVFSVGAAFAKYGFFRAADVDVTFRTCFLWRDFDKKRV
jgi:hypothetical protein